MYKALKPKSKPWSVSVKEIANCTENAKNWKISIQTRRTWKIFVPFRII